ncbi:hypothetical protein GCM10027293_34120 [Pontibacter aydingkolensis]
MITLKAPVARKQQGLYTFSADAVLILYFCTLLIYTLSDAFFERQMDGKNGEVILKTKIAPS